MLFFTFFYVNTVMSTFQTTRCKPDRPNSVFISCIMPKKSARKATLEVCGNCHIQPFDLDKKPTFRPRLTSAGAYKRITSPLFCAYRLYLLLNYLLTWVSVYRQTRHPEIIKLTVHCIQYHKC